MKDEKELLFFEAPKASSFYMYFLKCRKKTNRSGCVRYLNAHIRVPNVVSGSYFAIHSSDQDSSFGSLLL